MKNVNSQFKIAVTAGLLALFGSANAGQVGSLNTFTAGNPAVAADVNANFSEQTTQINDNDTRITALEQGDTDGLSIAELQGTYGAVLLETGELVKGGTDKSADNPIAGADNYFLSSFTAGSSRMVFDNAGTATLHHARFATFEMGHYTGLDGGGSTVSDTSRAKVDSLCDLSVVNTSPANINNGGSLELCDADAAATDTSDGSQDVVLSFEVINPAMRSIGADLIDTTTGEKLKLRGFVSMDGNVISMRVINHWCGATYDAATDSCTGGGGMYIGRGIITLVKVSN